MNKNPNLFINQTVGSFGSVSEAETESQVLIFSKS